MGEDTFRLKINDREYKVDLPLTNRELHLIKKIAGVRPAEFMDALEQGDTDMMVAFAHIAVRRSGAPRPSLDELWDMPMGTITGVEDEQDAGEDPTPPSVEPATDGNPETTPSPDGPPLTAGSSA